MRAKRVSLNRILCPVDFSDFSRRALARAGGLALRFGARVTALHVMPLDSTAMMVAGATAAGGYSAIPEILLRNQRQEAEGELARFVDPVRRLGVAVDACVFEGEPWTHIGEVAQALPADLVVMGTHGRTGWNRLLLGSTTEKVMHRLTCPLLTVGKFDALAAGSLFHRIICAVDLSPASGRTLGTASSLAEDHVTRITLLHVLEDHLGDRLPRLGAPAGYAGVDTPELVDLSLQQLRVMGRPARAFCEVEERVETGSAWREILRVSDKTKADLIVVGVHASGALGRILLGSTAEQVVRRASCPVLIVRELLAFESAVSAGASQTEPTRPIL